MENQHQIWLSKYNSLCELHPLVYQLHPGTFSSQYRTWFFPIRLLTLSTYELGQWPGNETRIAILDFEPSSTFQNWPVKGDVPKLYKLLLGNICSQCESGVFHNSLLVFWANCRPKSRFTTLHKCH